MPARGKDFGFLKIDRLLGLVLANNLPSTIFFDSLAATG